MSAHELKQMAPPVLSEMEGQPIYRDKDDVYLTRMGKRPVLKSFTIKIGWLTVIGWQATFASAMYLNGNMIQALIILTRSEYVPHPWRKALYAWGLSALSALINIVGGKFLPRFEGTILIFHVLGFFAILVPLTYMADHKSSAEEVFTYFINKGNWPSDALSVFVGLTGPVFAFAGGDAAVHLSAGPAVDRERNAPELSKNGQDKPVAVLSAQWL
ncbi:hypothetical protein APSETT445_002556 [Aspergillus pseudonomiae]